MRGNGALQCEIVRQQQRVALQARGTLFQQAIEYLAGCQQLTIQRRARVAADDELSEPQGRNEHAQHERGEREKDLRAEARSRPPLHGSPRTPCIAGRGRAGARASVKFACAPLAFTAIDWTVSSGFALLCACHAASLYVPFGRSDSEKRPSPSVTAK